MRLHTDDKFKQRNIEELNQKFNVEMYSTHVRGGKAFAAEQKICELKNFYEEVNAQKNLMVSVLNLKN